MKERTYTDWCERCQAQVEGYVNTETGRYAVSFPAECGTQGECEGWILTNMGFKKAEVPDER